MSAGGGEAAVVVLSERGLDGFQKFLCSSRIDVGLAEGVVVLCLKATVKFGCVVETFRSPATAAASEFFRPWHSLPRG